MLLLTRVSVAAIMMISLASLAGCSTKRNIQLIPDERQLRPGYTQCVLANDNKYVCQRDSGYITISSGYLREIMVALEECGHGVDGPILRKGDEEIRLFAETAAEQ